MHDAVLSPVVHDEDTLFPKGTRVSEPESGTPWILSQLLENGLDDSIRIRAAACVQACAPNGKTKALW